VGGGSGCRGRFVWACRYVCRGSSSGTFREMDVVGDLLGLAARFAGGVAVGPLVGVDVESDILGLQMGLRGSSGGRWEWKLWAIC